MEIVEKPEKLTKDLVAYNKAYRAEHKDYYKKYYETNKAVILEAMLKKVPCSCGCEIQQCNIKSDAPPGGVSSARSKHWPPFGVSFFRRN